MMTGPGLETETTAPSSLAVAVSVIVSPFGVYRMAFDTRLLTARRSRSPSASTLPVAMTLNDIPASDADPSKNSRRWPGLATYRICRAIACGGGRPPARIGLVLTSATSSAKAAGATMARGKVTSRRPVDSRITRPEACYVRGRNETDSHQRRYPAIYSNFVPIPKRRTVFQPVIFLGRDYGNYLDRVNVPSWRHPLLHLISIETGYCRQRWPQ